MTILGLGDVTEFCTNENTDFAKAHSMGCRKAFVRATTTGVWKDGKPSLKQDLMFAANMPKLIAAGIEPWSYCWFDPRKQLTGMEQALFFLDTINLVGNSRRLVVDVENSTHVAVYDAASIQRLRSFCEIITNETHLKPAIYTYPSFVDQMSAITDITWMLEYDLIIAHWKVDAPRIPFPWYPGCEIGWQYTAYAPGAPYGFVPPKKKPKLRICLAVWKD